MNDETRTTDYVSLAAQLSLRIRAASDVLRMAEAAVADLIDPAPGTPLPGSRGDDLLHEAEFQPKERKAS